MKLVVDILSALLMAVFNRKEVEVVVKKRLKPLKQLASQGKVWQILDGIMTGMGDNRAERYLPDTLMKTYNKAEVMDSLALREVRSIIYVKEVMDCDDFAAKLYGRFAGLVWTNTHALNWFIDEVLTFWWIEPQTGQVSRKIEGWQGTDIRFFIAR